MEAAVLGVAKSALNCLLSKAKSTIDDEVALDLGVRRDLVFLKEELAAMQTFLRAADEERNKHKVPRTRVKQVRDLAYDVEDCLQDFAVHLEKQSGWSLARTLLARHRIAEEMKVLRARVEDMSQRNLRYHLVEDLSSKPERSSIGNAEIFGINEARRQQDKDKARCLVRLINKRDNDLRVIAVWVTDGDLGMTSIVKRAYDDLDGLFECRAWVRLNHPFNPTEFLRSIMRQFHANSLQEGRKIREDETLRLLRTMGTMKVDDLAGAFMGYLNNKSYLIVLNDLSTIEEWDFFFLISEVFIK